MAIPSCLVDTNILLRMTRRTDPERALVDAALEQLSGQGTTLYYTHQNIAELWNAMTRPLDRNGFGLTAADAERQLDVIEVGMSLLADNESVYREWKRIILEYGVLGVQVHDARLAAAMYVHRVDHILTLNISDFRRFKGLTPLHPKKIELEFRDCRPQSENSNLMSLLRFSVFPSPKIPFDKGLIFLYTHDQQV